jgi:hypothetical protein
MVIFNSYVSLPEGKPYLWDSSNMLVTQRGVEAFIGALLGARDAADELEVEVRKSHAFLRKTINKW